MKKKKIVLFLIISLCYTPKISIAFNYNDYPAMHQSYKDTLTINNLNVTRIKQVLPDQNADMAFGIRYLYHDKFTGKASEKIEIFSKTELTKQTARLQERIISNQYLLDQNNIEFKEAHVIYLTDNLKLALTETISAITLQVIDANTYADIASIRDNGNATLDILYSEASGSAKTAIGILITKVTDYSDLLIIQITDDNCISKIAEYKTAITNKINEAIVYAPILDGDGFKTPFLASIDAFDATCDDKIALVASVNSLNTSLTSEVSNLVDELLGDDLTDAITSVKTNLYSLIDNFALIDYSSFKTIMQGLIDEYELELADYI